MLLIYKNKLPKIAKQKILDDSGLKVFLKNNHGFIWNLQFKWSSVSALDYKYFKIQEKLICHHLTWNHV